ncbi:hypothetical protein [Bacillus sp. FJAT-27264]|nr:hypothetical protein [Bacillus sp. FJAT-27264]
METFDTVLIIVWGLAAVTGVLWLVNNNKRKKESRKIGSQKVANKR